MGQNGSWTKCVLAMALPLLFLTSCNTDNKTGTPETAETVNAAEAPQPPKVKAPALNADSAFAFVAQQVKFGPRVPGTKAHAKCAGYLQQVLTRYGFNTQIQRAPVTTFDGKQYELKNIIGAYKPELKNRLLLCAHWDTRPFADRDPVNPTQVFDGANDGASGVGVLLEIARMLHTHQPNIGVDIILFDLEDYGQPARSEFAPMEDSWCLGSQYWARNLHQPGYKADYGILLDMVGAPNATFLQEGNSTLYAPELVKEIWNTARAQGFGNYFLNQSIEPITDDHLYLNQIAQIPSVDIVHMDPLTRDFGPFHHRVNDNLQGIDKNTLQAVGQTVLQVLYNRLPADTSAPAQP